MADVSQHSPSARPQPPARGILKNSFQGSPPHAESLEQHLSSKDITIANTSINAGHHHPPTGRMPRRHSSREGSTEHDNSQRLKWDEANLYLTEQERTSTMKITEPKTPYAKHYDPDEDPSDMDEPMGKGASGADGHHKTRRGEGDIPDLSLGEPEEEVPDDAASASGKKEKAVHVDDSASSHGDDELVGLSPEEREKHRRFEELRKKHYEMKDVAKLLGHAEGLEDEDEEQPIPPVPNGSS